MNHSNALRLVAKLYTFGLVAVIGVLVGCGSYHSPSNSLNISVSPASSTMPVSASITLQASGSLGKYTLLDWTINEATAAGVTCTFVNQTVPPPDPGVACTVKYGWIYQPPLVGVYPATTVTYYAPTQPGTFHVQASASLNQMSGQATSTISVQ